MPKHISPREREVVRLAPLGCTVPGMAKILGIAESTAENTKHRAMIKLGCNKAALLTRLALRMKITTLSDKLTPAEKRKAGWE